LVLSEKTAKKETKIALNGIAGGLYFLKISAGNQTLVKKIILAK